MKVGPLGHGDALRHRLISSHEGRSERLTVIAGIGEIRENLGPYGEPGLTPPGSGFGHTPGFLFSGRSDRCPTVRFSS